MKIHSNVIEFEQHANFMFAYVQFCLQETVGEHGKVHPAKWSHIYKVHTQTHTWNMYQLPQFTLGAPTIHTWYYNCLSGF